MVSARLNPPVILAAPLRLFFGVMTHALSERRTQPVGENLSTEEGAEIGVGRRELLSRKGRGRERTLIEEVSGDVHVKAKAVS